METYFLLMNFLFCFRTWFERIGNTTEPNPPCTIYAWSIERPYRCLLLSASLFLCALVHNRFVCVNYVKWFRSEIAHRMRIILAENFGNFPRTFLKKLPLFKMSVFESLKIPLPFRVMLYNSVPSHKLNTPSIFFSNENGNNLHVAAMIEKNQTLHPL